MAAQAGAGGGKAKEVVAAFRHALVLLVALAIALSPGGDAGEEDAPPSAARYVFGLGL